MKKEIKEKRSLNKDRLNTFVASARCDIKDIATIASYYIHQVRVPNNRSELISSALYHLADILRRQGAKDFPSYQKAWSYLESYGLSGKQQTKSLKTAIKTETDNQPINVPLHKVKSIADQINEKIKKQQEIGNDKKSRERTQ